MTFATAGPGNQVATFGLGHLTAARDGYDIRGCGWVVRSIALPLVAPEVRCAKKAKKKVRSWA
jgi:hypothetical protein